MSNSRTGETPGEKEAGTNLHDPAPPPVDAGPGVVVEDEKSLPAFLRKGG